MKLTVYSKKVKKNIFEGANRLISYYYKINLSQFRRGSYCVIFYVKNY